MPHRLAFALTGHRDEFGVPNPVGTYRRHRDAAGTQLPPQRQRLGRRHACQQRADQARALLEATRTSSDFPERDYCMAVLFLNCGMRLSELVGMNMEDIDLAGRQIRLFGKGHKERMVYLNDACVEALDLYLQKRGCVEGLSPKEPAVFITRRRKDRISNRRVEQLITGAMKAAGLKGFSTHKLRHTAATLMYQTGNVDVLTLKELLGHSNVGTTQIYTHLQDAQVRAAIEANPLGAAQGRPGAGSPSTPAAGPDISAEEGESAAAGEALPDILPSLAEDFDPES